MTVLALDPLRDPRWEDLVATHPASAVFHSRGWLEALRRTYGFEPLVFTTSPPDAPLTNGIVTSAIRSWLTGRRLVSVPFADHCDPLVTSAGEANQLIAALDDATRQAWKYVELRPKTQLASDRRLHESARFVLHTIDLRDDLERIHRRMHDSGIRRKIRRAEREGIRYEEGRSKALLDAFFELFVMTRQRHGSPPPPRQWFANLLSCLGEAAKVRVAWKDRRPVAAIVTLRHRTTMVYKYGASDAAFHNLGAMPFLFWQAIQDARAVGMEAFDLGRSDLGNTGLMTFKERLGGVPSPLTYVRCSARGRSLQPAPVDKASRVFTHFPKPVLIAAGRLLYRHIG